MNETFVHNVLVPEKTEIKSSFIDGEMFASHLLELSRNIEELKAEMCGILRKKYETHELVEFDMEYFCEKLLKLTELFQEIRNYSEKLPDRRKSLGGVEGRSVTIEAKINRLELLLSCCNWLLPVDGEVEAMRTSHRSNAFGDVVERYDKFKDLCNNVFDSFLTDEEARKEFPIVETVDRKVNMIAADVVVRLKKIFFGNIMWVKNSVETKLMIKCSEVEFIERWVEVLDSLEKFGCLERLIAEFFDDLMTYFFQPIMSSSYADVTISSQELIIRQDPLQVTRSDGKAKSLWERVCLLMSLLEFLFEKLKNPLEDKMKHLSLIEKLGSKGRGHAMFEFLINCLSPDRTDFALLTQEVRMQLVETFKLLLKDFVNKKFIKAEEASNLSSALNSLTSEPGLYSSILNNASKLVHENLHFAVKVGRTIKNEHEAEREQGTSADGSITGFNDNPVCSKFRKVFEACEDLLPDLMKFKECCISLSGSRIVDLFYEAMEVEATDPLTQPFTNSHHNNTNICNTTQNQTTSDASILNATSRNVSILGHDSVSSLGKGRKSRSEPVVKKTCEEELVRTYRCIRLVVELFVECMPTIHKRDVEGNALIAALHHNDCLYVSHHLLMLEHHMRPEDQKRKPKKGRAPPSSDVLPKLPLGLTFFDLQCDLKKLACNSLASFLARKQTEFADILKMSFDKRDAGENVENIYRRSMDALLEVKEHLFYLQKVWTGVLQMETLQKSLGALVNKVIHSVVEYCFNLALDFLPTRNKTTSAKVSSAKCDAPDSCNAETERLRNLLLDFTRTCLNFISDKIVLRMFDASCPNQILNKNVSSWKKLQELKFITEPFPSQRRVLGRWCVRDGKKGGEFVVNRNIVGEVLTAPEAKAFLSLAFSGSDLDKILNIFK